jgi:hypothetical protein
MSNDIEEMQVDFHRKATELFFSISRLFENTASKLNRKTNEYRFQELKKQYAITLEQELQTVAKDILAEHKDEKQSREVDLMFHQFIKDYLHRFVQKINAY